MSLTTPRRADTHLAPSKATSTPAPARTHIATTSVQPSYSTTRRHSLYGIEDRVVIDPGSRIWKVGFSGEGGPREVFYSQGKNGSPLWRLNRASDPLERAEEDRMLEIRLEKCLRTVFHQSLLTDPRARKIILVENALLPHHVKDILARILFENLQALSISFASNHLLSLLSVGRITGLVLDCGHLETTALPIFASRPLFPQLRTTPLAGARLTQHLRALLLHFGTYLPPPTSLSGPAPSAIAAGATAPASSRATRVPNGLLTPALLEEIKTRCCFVNEALPRAGAGAAGGVVEEDDPMLGLDVPTPSASDDGVPVGHDDFEDENENDSAAEGGGTTRRRLHALAALYARSSAATPLLVRVDPPPTPSQPQPHGGTGRGTLVVPGWVRERAAEMLFEGGDVDESSVAELILDVLLKVPVDLRKVMASSILCVGGTPMLPGFLPRLHAELLRALAPPECPPPSTGASPSRSRPRYAPLRALAPHLAILNNPSPAALQSDANDNSGGVVAPQGNAGSAPAFAPGVMAWIGGSLAGALKTGGVEVTREKWDEANRAFRSCIVDAGGAGAIAGADAGQGGRGLGDDVRMALPDWTLPPAAPGALTSAQAVIPRSPAQAIRVSGFS